MRAVSPKASAPDRRPAVQINGQLSGGERFQPLSQQSRGQAGQNVARAAGGHAGIAGVVDVEAAVADER